MKINLNRREFLGKSIGATVAMTAGGSVFAQQSKSAQGTKKNIDHPYNDRTHKVMPTRNLGKTGYQVGIMSLGGQATIEIKGKEDESMAIVNKAIDL